MNLNSRFPIRSQLAAFLLACTLVGCAERGKVQPDTNEILTLSAEPKSPARGKADLSPTDREIAEAQPKDTPAKKDQKSHIFQGTGVLVKKPSASPPSSSTADVNLNFESADIRDIAKTVLAEILQESYIVDPKVQGSISLRTVRPLTRETLLPTLETVLRMNGIVMIKESNVFKIMPAAAAKGSLSPSMGLSAGAGFTLQVVPLSFIGAREMAKILESVAADPSLVKTDELRNLLILAGTQNEIRHMLDTVEMFDVDWMSGMSVGLFVLQSADIKSVDQDMKKVFNEKGAGNPFAGVVRFIPIERLNAFVIITPQPKYLEQAKLWLERLDRVGGGGGPRLFVYHVQNGKAEHLAELLNQTFGGQGGQAAARTPAPQVAPGLTGVQLNSGLGTGLRPGGVSALSQNLAATTTPGTMQQPAVSSASLNVSDESGSTTEQVRVVADPHNNALLILANASGYEKIEAALKKLDQAPRQVLIELTIAEVTLKDELSYGVEWLLTNGSRRSGKLDLGTAGLNALVPGFSYAITSASNGSVKGILNMLATDNKLKILSSPQVMVADNQTAKIQVGDSVPTAGPQTISGTNIITSVQYLDTGVILAVTPRINAGGLVNLEVLQEVSTATTTSTSEINSPTISKRTARTVLSVQSGESIVMGGLISERSSGGSAGLPILSEIPILGGLLFGNKSRNNDRTELILLITPRVANNFSQAKHLSDELRRKMSDVKDLVDCGITNSLGYSTRGGLWCMKKEAADENSAATAVSDIPLPGASTATPRPQ